MQVYDFTLEDEVIALRKLKLRDALDNLRKHRRHAVYMEGMNMKEAAADSNINYRKALEIRKKSLSKLKDFL